MKVDHEERQELRPEPFFAHVASVGFLVFIPLGYVWGAPPSELSFGAGVAVAWLSILLCALWNLVVQFLQAGGALLTAVGVGHKVMKLKAAQAELEMNKT